MSNGQNNNKGCNLHQFQRNNYFYGKLMTVRDFEDEQSYLNEKRHLLNRLIHSSGIVCGFELGDPLSSPNDEVEIRFIKGGVVLDCCGHEIVVPVGTVKKVINEKTGSTLTRTQVTSSLYLYLKHKPCFGEMVNAASNPSSCEETCCPSRIIEDFEVVASAIEPSTTQIQCPDLSGATDSNDALKKIREWTEIAIKSCPECDEARVFLAAIKSDLTIDKAETGKFKSFVYNNKLLSELITCHVSDFSNPHKSLKGLEAENKKVENLDGYITIDRANAITLSADQQNHKITIGETHSGETGNPHQTGHSELAEVLEVDPSETDTTRNKHVSNADGNRWNSAILKINDIAPVPDTGNFTIEAGNNVAITPGTNKITIASPGGGGAECLTGLFIFKEVEAGRRYTSPPVKLPGHIFGIILGVEYKYELATQKLRFIVTGDDLLQNGIALTSKLNLITHKLTVSLTSAKETGILRVRWWAIMPTKDMGSVDVPVEIRISRDDIIKDIALSPNITMKKIMDEYKVTAPAVEEIINPLIEEGAIKVTGTGVNKKFKINI